MMTAAEIRPVTPRNAAICLALVAAFTIALTLHGYLSRPTLDRWGDTYENYAWGVLWQWGYFKHPPFFAWEAAAWFLVFPKTDFFYFLLAGVNAGLVLIALWRIAARFGGTGFQVLVMVLALVMPTISFQGLNFNANCAMTPIWAFLFLFYLRGLEKGRLTDAAMIGLLAGIAMLTKYQSAVMLGALFVHALIDREARPLLFSRFGLVVVLVFLLAFGPHVLWLAQNDFRPIAYADDQGDEDGASLLGSLRFLVAPIGFSALSILVARSMRDWGDRFPLLPLDGVIGLKNTVQGRALIAFAALPLLLTIVLGYFANAELSAVWGIPFYSAYALIIALLVPGVYYEMRMRRALLAGGIFMAIIVIIAPFWYLHEKRVETGGYYNAPLSQIAEDVDRRWKDAGGGKGALLFGQVALANPISFYSRLDPITLEGDSFDIAKSYLSLEEARRRGLIGLCQADDKSCEDEVASVMPRIVQPQEFSVPSVTSGRIWHFRIWMSPPQP